MRRSIAGLAWVVLAACGGGGGGSGGSTPVSGTIGGQPFTPAEASAVVAGPATCTVQSQTVSVKAFALRFTSYTGACTDLTSDPLCKLTASSQSAMVVFADVGAVSPPTLGAGTFQVDPDPTNVRPGGGALAGTLVASFGGYVATTASCPAGTTARVAKGTLTVTSVSATEIAGSIDVIFGTLGTGNTFVPGTDTLKGDFTATVCGTLAADLCSLATAGGQCGGSLHC